MPATLPAPLRDLAQRQAGVLRRDQVLAVLSRGQVRAQLRAGRWQRVGSTVVVLHAGPLTDEQAAWAAVLAAGPAGHAALAGRSALTAAGVTGWNDGRLHVVVGHGGRMPVLPDLDVVVHESRRFLPGDLHPARTPPQTRLERSAVDAAAWSRSPRTACAVLAACVQQRHTTAPRLLAALVQAGSVRHVQILRRALRDIEGGAHALSEIDFGRFCERRGLGRVVRQVVRLDAAGRRRYLDVVIEAPDGTRVAVELDGAQHLLVTTYWLDMRRHNELVIAGETVLRFPTVTYYAEPEVVADQVRRAQQAVRMAA